MACKKSELISGLNSFAAACTTGDANLIGLSSSLVGQLLETLEFAPEENEEPNEVKEAEPV
jgi:hypothetical protein